MHVASPWRSDRASLPPAGSQRISFSLIEHNMIATTGGVPGTCTLVDTAPSGLRSRARGMHHRRGGGGGSLLDVRDRDLDLHARLDGDARDLLDDLRRRVQIDQALVDTHLEAVPRVPC